MLKNTRIRIGMLCACLMLIMTGCEKESASEKKGPFIYYINAEATGFEKVPVTLKGYSSLDQAQDLLKKMAKAPKDATYTEAIPKQVEIYDLTLSGDENHTLTISVSEGYNTLDAVSKVLFRESLVRTLTQIRGLDGISLTVEGEPAKDGEGQLIGEMTKDTFLRDTGSALHAYSKTQVTLYYPDENGKNLIAVEKNIRYRSNISIEKAVVQELKKTPTEKHMERTLPKNVKVLGVSLKDGICYVNFDEKFLDGAYKAQPETVIYSLVNSIIDAGSASEVQFFVNGEKDVRFQGSLSLKEPFDRNLDLLPEGGKNNSEKN